MNKIAISLAAVIIGAAINCAPAKAGTATDALSACLAESTTGKDRKDMARWVFVEMAVHPEIKDLSNATDRNRDELDRTIAMLFTKLLSEKCPAQAKLAMKIDGSAALGSAFKIIGELAMQELMSNPKVDASFTKFTGYLDQERLNSVLSEK
jgi:hypothetical protein